MLELAAITSLKILFVWAAMQEGMILHLLRRIIEKLLFELPTEGLYLWFRKPLFECLFCMASFWGIIFTLDIAEFSWEYLTFLFTVGGINYLISCLIKNGET